ncbi:lipopolysaccharide biosynthesis protein [Arthrobacter sp. NA-172]|uniref:lipopolysaccharide biosynthesis protein n=1 Tax=Arthrobacter sp. NA-172 TaxID=3367524 RepID=UPI003754B0E7
MKSRLKRLLGFSALPFISAMTPLLLLPIVARLGGPEGWASVSIGQAVGAFGSVAIGYGSMIWGPPAIASSSRDVDRRAIYARVLSSKVLISCIVFPSIVLITMMMSPPKHLLEGIGMALSMALIGWSPSWYLIGLGKPGPIAIVETIPKLVATALSACLLLWTGIIWFYPLCLILATGLGLSLFHRQVLGSMWPRIRPFSLDTLRMLRFRSNAALIDASGVAYVAAPIPVVSTGGNVSEISSVASGDKIYRYGLFGIVALANAVQGWVLEPKASDAFRRHIVAIVAHITLGLIGLVFLCVAGPLATEILFGSSVAAKNPMMAFYGVAYFSVSASTPFVRNLLIPAGKTRVVLSATIIGAVIGLPSMMLFNSTSGASGVALGLAISEVLVLVITVFAAIPLIGNFRHLEDSETSALMQLENGTSERIN